MLSTWREPLHPPSQEAFKACLGLLDPGDLDQLILDSGCGTGQSTRALAQMYPQATVIGVDRSAARLSKTNKGPWPVRQGSCVLVRADLTTFWRMAKGAGWQLKAHFLLYPNPWPKSGQVLRRWHAHPVFPELLQLGGKLELRSNWALYVEEFAKALQLATQQLPRTGVVHTEEGISPFERKYAASGHTLYRLQADLRSYASRQARLF